LSTGLAIHGSAFDGPKQRFGYFRLTLPFGYFRLTLPFCRTVALRATEFEFSGPKK
jgi:hypothetical protein